MKQKLTILLLLFTTSFLKQVSYGQSVHAPLGLNFFGDSISLPVISGNEVSLTALSDNSVQSFYDAADDGRYEDLVGFLSGYKKQHELNDWLYYQLIRKTANAISPKSQNYHRYTLYKWFLLGKSGYDAVIRIISDDRLLFYVQSNDNIYNIPTQTSSGNQFVCLNYHDYGSIDLENEKAYKNNIHIPGAKAPFSYKLSKMPDFNSSGYTEKDLKFSYHNQDYRFKVRLNPVVKDIFMNYPVVDFEAYFNIPMSKETYASLLPELKSTINKMDQKQGIDYLMHFTRYAFAFEKDADHFGKEKRLAPEETLLYEHSDCEDRSGLFFYLVKEIYDLPMITLLYPEHVTIAIQFDKPVGKTITYKGRQYSVCEPTPQQADLKIGQLPLALRNASFDVGYEYIPGNK
ncbi:MAG: hypothetical protein V4722_01030 [Bacteroidota bacterium]